MIKHYILNEKGEPILEPDLMTWAKWMGTLNHIVGQTEVQNVRVSTVFLGLDHNFDEDGPPIYWETMTFSKLKRWSHKQWRCSGSREQAEAMHQSVVELVMKDYDKEKKETEG